MPRQAVASQRMPSQRDHAQLDMEAEVCEAKLEAIEWRAYAYKVRNQGERNLAYEKRKLRESRSPTSGESDTAPESTKRKCRVSAQRSEALLESTVDLLSEAQLRVLEQQTAVAEAAKAAAAEQEAAAQTARAAAAEQEARAKEAEAALEAAQLAQRRVRLKLKGRFFQAVRGGAAAISPEPPLAEVLPAGCRLLEDAVPQWEVEDAVSALEAVFGYHGGRRDSRVKAIKSGQHDLKRLQLKMEESEHTLFSSLKFALGEAGEARGRKLREFNVLSSQPTCTVQELHWDYDPNRATGQAGPEAQALQCHPWAAAGSAPVCVGYMPAPRGDGACPARSHPAVRW